VSGSYVAGVFVLAARRGTRCVPRARLLSDAVVGG